MMKHSLAFQHLRGCALAALLLGAQAAWALYAAPSRQPPPPPVAQPLPSRVDTTDWVLVKDVGAYENGRMKFCPPQANGLASSAPLCPGAVSMTPEDALRKLAPAGSVLTGMAPFVDGSARMIGVLLYYRRPAAR